MARSRNIKPSFFINDELAKISAHGRLLFIGLWTIADREGRLQDKPEKIKIQVLPYDKINVDKLLQDLHDTGFILRYETDNCPCIQILNFHKHQNPHMKEQASELPAPNLHHASTMQAPNKHGTCPADSLNPLIDTLNPLPVKSGEGASSKKDHEKLFQELWKLYPRKKGIGGVSDTQKEKLYKIGRDEMERCIDRFIRDMAKENRPLDKYPYGSTFFNSGYVDYLDINYHQDKPPTIPKRPVIDPAQKAKIADLNKQLAEKLAMGEG